MDRRLFCPLLLTHASLSACGLLSALVCQLGKRPAFGRETNLAAIARARLAQKFNVEAEPEAPTD